jgi:hypothetical protein
VGFRVLGQRAFLDEIFGSFLLETNLDQLRLSRVMLTKMLAQTTLTTVKLNYLDHIGPSFHVSARYLPFRKMS